MSELEDEEIEGMIERSKRKRGKAYKQAKREFEVEEFRRMLVEYREERRKVEAMSKEEREVYMREREQVEEVLRPDMEMKEYPMIVKASTAGTLETLLNAIEKEVKKNPHI